MIWLMLSLTLCLLLVTLFIPPVQHLFGFLRIPVSAFGWCALAALAGVGWIEGHKAFIHSRKR